MSRCAIALLGLLFMLAGCGQKGPLYLPGDTSTIRMTVPQQQAPAEESDEEESEAPPAIRD